MRLLVCGGRTYGRKKDRFGRVKSEAQMAKEEAFLYAYLDRVVERYGRPDIVIQGGAKGADALARSWAQARGYLGKTFEANWSRGPKAGRERNGLMLNAGRPTHVVAFPGGPGTEHMVEISKARAGVLVIEADKMVL